MKLQNIRQLKFPLLALGVLLFTSACTEAPKSNVQVAPTLTAAPKVSANATINYKGFSDSQSAQLSDANNALWEKVDANQIDLVMAPAVHQSIALRKTASSESLPVNFQVTQDNENIYIRLSWLDASENKTHAFEKFADSAAIQFAINGKESTNFMMGSPDAPVNIWYWNAGKAQTQNLAAGGFGTLSPTGIQEVNANASYNDSQWNVVFSRPKLITGDYQIDLTQGGFDVIFAVWQGESKQRDGLKATSTSWISLSLTP